MGLQAKFKAIFMMLLRLMKKLVTLICSSETWKKKRAWIGAFVGLRAAYVYMNEYGMNPFKKSLNGDHVFLTGAGSGLG